MELWFMNSNAVYMNGGTDCVPTRQVPKVNQDFGDGDGEGRGRWKVEVLYKINQVCTELLS